MCHLFHRSGHTVRPTVAQDDDDEVSATATVKPLRKGSRLIPRRLGYDAAPAPRSRQSVLARRRAGNISSPSGPLRSPFLLTR
jgi:hypothetical protein